MENRNVKQTQITEKKKSSDKKNLKKCDICGEYHEKNVTHTVEIKGRKKNICQGCADTIHGLV